MQVNDAIYIFVRSHSHHHIDWSAFSCRINHKFIQSIQKKTKFFHFYLRASLLMNRLFKMLSVYNGTNFTHRIWSPIWCYDFDFGFTSINSEFKKIRIILFNAIYLKNFHFKNTFPMFRTVERRPNL